MTKVVKAKEVRVNLAKKLSKNSEPKKEKNNLESKKPAKSVKAKTEANSLKATDKAPDKAPNKVAKNRPETKLKMKLEKTSSSKKQVANDKKSTKEKSLSKNASAKSMTQEVKADKTSVTQKSTPLNPSSSPKREKIAKHLTQKADKSISELIPKKVKNKKSTRTDEGLSVEFSEKSPKDLAQDLLVEKHKKPLLEAGNLRNLKDEPQSAIIKKWTSLQKKAESKGIKAVAYSMTKQFEASTPIQHKLLGWGYILNNVNDRLEVLFKDGVKYLISNYK